MEIKCEICSTCINCVCKNEQSKLKYRSCATTNVYPRSQLNFNAILIHLCSKLCADKFDASNNPICRLIKKKNMNSHSNISSNENSVDKLKSSVQNNMIIPDDNTTNIIEDKSTYFELKPKNIVQSMTRNIIDDLNSKIKENHCLICGDTEQDGKLVKIKMKNSSVKYFCEFCHNIQTNVL